MIKSKLLLLMGLITLICFTLSAGSLALFSSEAISPGNKLTTGILDINGLNDCAIELNGLMPGEPSQEVTLTVNNSGTVPGYLSGISTDISENENKYVSNAIKVFCYDDTGNVLFEGSLLALDNNVVPLNEQIELKAQETQKLKLTFQLDERAGNWYEGKNIQFSLTIYAGQTPEQKVGRTVILANKNDVQEALTRAIPGDVVLVPPGTYNTVFEIPSPGVTVKAIDVVYNTAVNGFVLNTRAAAGDNKANIIQGFTIINASGNGVDVLNCVECKITDNIVSSKCAVNLKKSCREVVTRNDLGGSEIINSGNVGANDIFKNNLGADIKLAEDFVP